MRFALESTRSRAAHATWATVAMCLLPALGEAQFPVRSIDGTGNNLDHPYAGKAGARLRRRTSNAYEDGSGSPSMPGMPNPRLVSNLVCAQDGLLPNTVGASDMVWQWGQFLDHDLDLTVAMDPSEPLNISVPAGDPWFDPNNTGLVEIALNRSFYRMTNGVREQMNAITSWIDASNVYGSSMDRALELRTLDGTGRLKASPHPDGDLLPFNVNGFPNEPVAIDPTLFLAGDVRANEQVGLTSMHTLFVREHNALADFFGSMFPNASGDARYELARMFVIAEIQAITYNEFLPVLLGPIIPPYAGYDASVNPTIENVFSTACYRFGHSMLSPQLMRRGADLQPIPDGDLPLREAFFNPSELIDNGGIAPILRGLSMQLAQDVDPYVVDDVRNFLFGPPGAGGFDLASLNIQRGRDHGLPHYNQTRVDVGLAPMASFDELTSDADLRAALETTYGSIDAVDPWVGGLAEDAQPGALVGELVQRVLADQFARLRRGDRLWYENLLPDVLVAWVNSQTLSVIIERNTGASLALDVFHVPTPN